MLQIETDLVQFVQVRKDTWVPVRAFECAPVIPVILSLNMKDLVGTARLEEARATLLLHADLPEGAWYAIPVGTIMSKEGTPITAITRYRLAAISLSPVAPEGAVPL